MTEIKYIKADATFPQSEGNIIIPHICNDIGAWGKGFVLALSKRWKAPEKQYKLWYQEKEGFVLGAVQFVQVEENIQGEKGIPPIGYEAVREGLEKVASFAQEKQACIQMPRIGCGLAGGTWEKIVLIIEEILLTKHIQVTVCDL